MGGREAYKREKKVMKWEQCTEMKHLLLVGEDRRKGNLG